jgi:hypothetical protein
MSWVSDLVAPVQGRGRLERAYQVEFDVLRGKVVQEPSAVAEQHRPELNLYGVEHPVLEGLLGGVGTVHEDVAIAGGCFGLLHAGGDAIGDVVDLLERVRGGWLVGRNEDRDAVVMVAVPVAGEVPVRFPVITAPVASISSNTIWLLGSWGRNASTPLASPLPPPSQSMGAL